MTIVSLAVLVLMNVRLAQFLKEINIQLTLLHVLNAVHAQTFVLLKLFT